MILSLLWCRPVRRIGVWMSQAPTMPVDGTGRRQSQLLRRRSGAQGAAIVSVGAGSACDDRARRGLAARPADDSQPALVPIRPVRLVGAVASTATSTKPVYRREAALASVPKVSTGCAGRPVLLQQRRKACVLLGLLRLRIADGRHAVRARLGEVRRGARGHYDWKHV